jgi:Flagellar hook-length control protein FliK
MPISINPVLPVLAAQEVGAIAPDLVLQPGSVVNAQVLKVLSADLVRIAISSLSIDVLSEVPLQEGQTLQLAVSQTPDGIRLAMVGQGADAGSLSADAVTLSPEALIDGAANPPTSTAAPKNVLTPLERIVVSAAAQTAAREQQSLAPLFANLGAVAASGDQPPKLQQAIAQVLAQQTSLDQNLDGGDIKTAFEKSGLFLEASLASGTVPSAGSVPDLKAALIVLRQTLQSLGTTEAAATTVAQTTVEILPSRTAATPSLVPSAPDLDVQEILLPQARVPVADDLLAPGSVGRSAPGAALDAGPSAGATLNLLQEALQEFDNPARQTGIPKDLRNADVTVHTNTPPPPFRGALPAAQPIASPSIAPGAPLATSAHHLLENTDAAIARQTLLQVASLPDRIDNANPQIDITSPRWSFEIPFATPQGTAMAQFEISRDGAEAGAEAAKRVWRARFSLDVEPAGPVHALVSLVDEKTSVRMWAERPATAAQLRAGAAQLSQALAKAELQPGAIVIRDGAPPLTAPARAGHFLDRAL